MKRYYYYPHFLDEETEGKLTSSKVYSFNGNLDSKQESYVSTIGLCSSLVELLHSGYVCVLPEQDNLPKFKFRQQLPTGAFHKAEV